MILGTVAAAGTLRPDELADAVGVALPEGPWETIAGYVLAQLGHLPTAGDRLATDVGVFTISRMDGYRIIEIELRARHRGT
jgi:CBS domain containing-hemolysin-like protein